VSLIWLTYCANYTFICWTAKCMVGRIYRISCVCHRTTGTNAYRNANIVRHVPKPHLIELHAISLLSDFFPLWPLSTSGIISSAAIIMYKCYLENWQFCGDQFNVSPLRGKAGSSADVVESATCLEVSQVHQTWYFSIFMDARSACVSSYNLTVLAHQIFNMYSNGHGVHSNGHGNSKNI